MVPYTKRRFPAKKRKVKRVLKKSTVSRLARDIAVLKKKTATVTSRDQYWTYEGIDVASPYVVKNLCNYSSWSKLWPSTGTDIATVRNEMYHRYIMLDNNVTLDNANNEEGEIQFTYMIISRKDAAGSATDTGNSLSLTDGVDYALAQGKAYMNLKKWKVHFVKRFTLTGGDGSDLQPGASLRRFSCRIKVGAKIVNPDGSWTSLSNSPDPSDTYYAVLFNDNSSADLENPRWTAGVYHSVDQ